MRMIREILRLYHSCGLSKNRISQSIGCARSSVREYIGRAQSAGLSWPLPQELDDDDLLEKRLFSGPISEKQRPQPDCNYIHQELKKKGVTLELLWQEYKEENPNGYQQTQFCAIYREWRKSIDLVMRQEHKAGDKAFSDFAGATLPIYDPRTGDPTPAYLFVCALGASAYTFAHLFWTQSSESWCMGHALAFSFFQGSPNTIVPDNPKAVISKPCRYEPDVNPSFAQMANFFDVAVIPARVKHPRDKAVVEMAVGVATRCILAVLRHRKFFSLAEANAAIAELLEKLNNRQFKKMPGSRRVRFEQLDKPALKPLPEAKYEYMHIQYASVHIADYHVEYEGSWYSVPFSYRGRQVEVRATTHTVEIYLRGKRIASHPRHIFKGSRSTLNEHRPKQHKDYGEWPPERIVRWAARVGPAAKALVERIIESHEHPEQGYRSCFGILRLGKTFGDARLNAACSRALAINACSLKSVKSMLKAGLENRPLPEKPPQLKIIHENIRGASSFRIPNTQENLNNADATNNR